MKAALFLALFLFFLFVVDGSSISELIERGKQDFLASRGQSSKRSVASKSEKLEWQCGEHLEESLHPDRFEQTAQRSPPSHSENTRSMHKRDVPWTPIRFVLNTTYLYNDTNQCTYTNQSITISGQPYICDATDVVTDELRDFIVNNVLPTALSVFESLLTIQRAGEFTYFPQSLYALPAYQYCGVALMPIPTEYLENATGLHGDMWITVSVRPFGANFKSVAASCGACMFLEDYPYLGRPIAAGVNLGPTFLNNIINGSDWEYGRLIRYVIHELTHGLGMNNAWVNNQYRGVSQYNLTTSERGDTVRRFTGPSVAQFAQEHFNCPTLPGFEVENNGGGGTAGVHWKQRIAVDELMAGVGNLAPLKISNLTLGFLQDLGFYRVNLTMAEVLIWGKNKGCDFALNKCNTGGEWNSPGYYCSVHGQIGCTFDRASLGQCRLTNTSGLPSKYSYFSYPITSGVVSTMDYCPTYIYYDAQECGEVGGEVGFPGSYAGSDFTSACFSASNPSIPVNNDCFRYRCTGMQLEIHLNDGWHACGDGTVISDSVDTEVTCPLAAEQFCLTRLETTPIPEPPSEPIVPPPVEPPTTPVPIAAPVAAPTASPVGSPSAAPTSSPVGSPFSAPSESPDSSPTGLPVASATPETGSPIDSPSMISVDPDPPTSSPTQSPTAPPVIPPVEAPVSAPAKPKTPTASTAISLAPVLLLVASFAIVSLVV